MDRKEVSRKLDESKEPTCQKQEPLPLSLIMCRQLEMSPKRSVTKSLVTMVSILLSRLTKRQFPAK